MILSSTLFKWQALITVIEGTAFGDYVTYNYIAQTELPQLQSLQVWCLVQGLQKCSQSLLSSM